MLLIVIPMFFVNSLPCMHFQQITGPLTPLTVDKNETINLTKGCSGLAGALFLHDAGTAT